ncbi:hypothetical protein QJS83_16335 [Bdellovibrio sp. 22V]|uniref:hypothetical protein n=1 Tax=Bdellovibrio sp. 22V TaxID=3044166 RepID=UPI002542B9E4|nr:hypothetical protein [Bdellovibrio sp. 22V]WII72032.1 hypothetical protein QJS83_16335 [Bdellovibrio sp. 22V]
MKTLLNKNVSLPLWIIPVALALKLSGVPEFSAQAFNLMTVGIATWSTGEYKDTVPKTASIFKFIIWAGFALSFVWDFYSVVL